MSTAAPARTWATTGLRYLPGLLLLLAVGIIGTLTQTGLRSVATATGTRLPDIEYVLWAIVLGLLIRNTVGVPAIFRPGVATYEFWLKIGIVLLGARFLLGDLAKLGGFSFLLIIIDMVVATTVIILVGHLFGLGGKLSTLLGFIAVSAIATSGLLAKPAITSLGNLSKWAFLLCFAGVGLNSDLRELARAGIRPLVVAALGLVVVAACSLGLVLLTSGWLTPVGR